MTAGGTGYCMAEGQLTAALVRDGPAPFWIVICGTVKESLPGPVRRQLWIANQTTPLHLTGSRIKGQPPPNVF